MINNFHAAIERCKARGDSQTARRIETERKMVSALVRHALANAMTVSVYDGMEWTLEKSTSYEAIFDALFTTDMDVIELCAAADGKRIGSFQLIYGNDGYDVIADYTVNDTTEAIWNDVIMPLSDRLEAAAR